MSGVIFLIIRVLTALALYAFLGWALFTLWSDLRYQGQSLNQRTIPTLNLYLEGPLETKEIKITIPEATVGRTGISDFIIDDETVSSRHARLIYKQNQWWVEDMKSTNGTFLNGEQIHIPVVLTTGDLIGFGTANFVVAISQD